MARTVNMGTADRAVRLLVGLGALAAAFLVLGVTDGKLGGIVAAAAGAIMLLTAAVRFCPMYCPLGLSTCKVKGT